MQISPEQTVSGIFYFATLKLQIFKRKREECLNLKAIINKYIKKKKKQTKKKKKKTIRENTSKLNYEFMHSYFNIRNTKSGKLQPFQWLLLYHLSTTRSVAIDDS